MLNGAYFSKDQIKTNLSRLSILAPIFVAVYYIAFWLRFGDTLDEEQWQILGRTVAWVASVKLVFFGLFHVYRAWSRQVTLHELLAISKATVCSVTCVWLLDRLFVPGYSISRFVLLLDLGGTILAVGGLRVFWRLMLERFSRQVSSRQPVRTFIAGIDSSSEVLLRVIRRSDELLYQVVGFLDCSSGRVGMRVDGIPVRGTLDQTRELVRKHAVKEVLIIAGDLSGLQVRQLVEDCRHEQVRVTVLPSYEQLLTGQVSVQPRPVTIEDLLRRDPVELDLQQISQWIDNRVIMVTGSAGSIGTEICRQLLQFTPRKLIVVDRSENGQFYLDRELLQSNTPIPYEICVADISDRWRMQSLFDIHRPEIVFHAAAYKHVPLMEQNPGEAVKNILLATCRLADLAEEYQVDSFVMISTDKAVQPTSIMGACKRAAELYIQAIAKNSSSRFITVRFGNVLDSAGSVVPIFREQINRGGPVTVTDPRMQRFFMTIPEASQLVIQAAANGQDNEIFVLDMGEPVQIVDLAADMIRLSGFRVGEDIEIEFSGVRPGEKLYEELYSCGERRLPTRHPKILIAEQECVDAEEIFDSIERLVVNAEEGAESIVSGLQQIVPSFRSQQLRVQRRAA